MPGGRGRRRRCAPSRRGRRSAAEPDRDAAGDALEAFLATYAGRRGADHGRALTRRPRRSSLVSLGTLLGWPVLAEPLSGLRLDASEAGRALAAGQLLVGDPAWLARHRPEVVLQAGATPTTRATQALVAAADASWSWTATTSTPIRRSERSVGSTSTPSCSPRSRGTERRAATHRPPPIPPGSTPGARPTWSPARPSTARSTRWEEPIEGRVARDVAAFIPNGARPRRGVVDARARPRRVHDAAPAAARLAEGDLVRVIANRGASGIDGFVSTVLGAAAATDRPVYALLGDLTLLHDAGGLLWSGARGTCGAVIVVIANRGRSDLLAAPPARAARVRVAVRHAAAGRDRRHLHAANIGHVRVDSTDALVPALGDAAERGGVQVVEVAVDAEAQARPPRRAPRDGRRRDRPTARPSTRVDTFRSAARARPSGARRGTSDLRSVSSTSARGRSRRRCPRPAYRVARSSRRTRAARRDATARRPRRPPSRPVPRTRRARTVRAPANAASDGNGRPTAIAGVGCTAARGRAPWVAVPRACPRTTSTGATRSGWPAARTRGPTGDDHIAGRGRRRRPRPRRMSSRSFDEASRWSAFAWSSAGSRRTAQCPRAGRPDRAAAARHEELRRRATSVPSPRARKVPRVGVHHAQPVGQRDRVEYATRVDLQGPRQHHLAQIAAGAHPRRRGRDRRRV